MDVSTVDFPRGALPGTKLNYEDVVTAAEAPVSASQTERAQRGGKRRLPNRAELLMAAVPALLLLFEGWNRRWVADDSYIDFRVVGNIASGHGPVFNPGERVEAFTDPLWVGILTVFHFFFFLPIQWWAVLLGLFFTVAGVASAARAAQKLGRIIDGPKSQVVPLGIMIFTSVDAAWDFATSGLETGLIFGWIGLSWWLSVRAFQRRAGSVRAACAIGLGPLIRPDLLLITLPLLGGLAAISTVDTVGWRTAKRIGAQAAAAFAAPAIYEVFRMAYFGLLVPNTALAKTAGTAWWSQGLTYLRDMIGPYWLWFPLILVGLLLARRLGALSNSGRHRLAILLAAPVVGGLLDAFYVVRVGGDFMHARMLLPGLFAMCMPVFVSVRSLKAGLVVALGLIWSLTAVATLHASTNQAIVNGIANERGWYIAHSQNPHPVTADEFARGDFAKVGVTLRGMTLVGDPGMDVILLEPTQGDTSYAVEVPAVVAEKVIAPVSNVGISGLAAGPAVYIFDQLSLSNPIGAHVSDTERIRPGHSQKVSTVWMVARFVPPASWGTVQSSIPPDLATLYNQADLSAARAAMSCGRLRSYLQGITKPLTAGQVLSNIFHSVSYTTLRFSPNPVTAQRQLCGAHDPARGHG